MNENQDNLTDNTLAGDAHVTSTDGGAAVAESLSLAELNQTLGKTFKDTATALVALKETQSWVGKKIDAANPALAPVDTSLKEKVNSLEKEVFYASNPQFKGHETIIQAMGSNPADVVNGEAFKSYFEKAKVADEVAQTKSVVASNSRLSQSKTTLDSAVQVANARGTTQEDVALVFAEQINREGRGE